MADPINRRHLQSEFARRTNPLLISSRRIRNGAGRQGVHDQVNSGACLQSVKTVERRLCREYKTNFRSRRSKGGGGVNGGGEEGIFSLIKRRQLLSGTRVSLLSSNPECGYSAILKFSKPRAQVSRVSPISLCIAVLQLAELA